MDEHPGRGVSMTERQNRYSTSPTVLQQGIGWTLQCDASDMGLGAALTQKGKPVAFGSSALTPTEKGYAQIEKECLAIVFGIQRFHQYTYGREVTVQSDHKPLENIHSKPLLNAPKRLQRRLLRLQQYDIRVTYVPGRDMLLADTLSRAYLP